MATTHLDLFKCKNHLQGALWEWSFTLVPQHCKDDATRSWPRMVIYPYLLIFGGFHKLGSPNSWLVYFMENPKMDDLGVPLWLMKPPFESLFRFGSLCQHALSAFSYEICYFCDLCVHNFEITPFRFCPRLNSDSSRFVLTRMLTSSMANTKHIGGLVIKNTIRVSFEMYWLYQFPWVNDHLAISRREGIERSHPTQIEHDKNHPSFDWV